VNEITFEVPWSLLIVSEVCSRGKKTENERKGAVQGTAAD